MSAKVVQRRLGLRGTTGQLLRKAGELAVSAILGARAGAGAECQSQASINPSRLPRHSGLAPSLWNSALLSAQALLPAHFSTLFLPYSLGEAQASVHWDVAQQSLPWDGERGGEAQSSAAGHKPLAPNWQLEAVGGRRA